MSRPGSHLFSRRAALIGGGYAAALAPLGLVTERAVAASRVPGPVTADLFDPSDICRVAAPGAAADGALRKIRLTWNANSICTIAVPIAQEKGFFAKHGLEVELISFGGSTDALLEAIATGKADAGLGMALRWLKPLEQGFDVKLVSGVHGGCIRLLTTQQTGLKTLSDFRGKRIAVGDLAGADKNFFAIALGQAGINPVSEVTWRQFPSDLLVEAVKRGEADGAAFGDPLGFLLRERDSLIEVHSNLHEAYASRTCCVLGIRGSLIRDDRPVAIALTRALLEAGQWGHHNVDEAARIFSPNAPNRADNAQLAAMLRSHTHGDQPRGDSFREQIRLYAEELKAIEVFRSNTDAARYAQRVTVDLLG